VLIECLAAKPAEHHAEIMFALGKSRDARAFGPLLEILQKDEYGSSGYAALALRHLGRLEAEAPLIAFYRAQRRAFSRDACLPCFGQAWFEECLAMSPEFSGDTPVGWRSD